MRRRIFSYITLLFVLVNVSTAVRAADAVSARVDERAVIARQEEAFHLPAEQRPASWIVLRAGDLGTIFNRKEDGVDLLSLFDLAKHRQLLAKKPLPLFTITLRHLKSRQELTLAANGGWQQVAAALKDSSKEMEFRWQKPADKRLGDLRVRAAAFLDRAAGAICWKLSVDNVAQEWSVRRVAFPLLALDASGPQFTSFYPQGSGRIKVGPWNGVLKGCYPNGWTTMQYLAAYDPQLGSGLYCAMHDPLACVKDIHLEGRSAERDVVFVFGLPAENMDVGGNGYTMPGDQVWQVLHGDWFDAATIYRAWVRRNASWFPRLGPDGRSDTPLWMRELPLWLRADGDPEDVVPTVEAFAKTMGVSLGVHWYNWHQIPFDNDYPHFFPVKEGFGEAVRKLQGENVYVMPYINGRLWDTRDKGLEDFEFSRLALPAASKNEDGTPRLEIYRSKETDGSPVRLAAMCPSTELWQSKVRATVLRLMNEFGVKGVYVDQIAAASPVLCFDRSHGHPAAGGHWWVDSYNSMLDALRRVKPADCMITTECNAEPYLKRFDGYLTWHWCVDGQVPAFPAVYGGTVQMFGRAYRGGETKDLALRMKAGQQFVYGEQIGWFDADVVQNEQNLDFLQQVVGLRWRLRRYFYAGEMARPPKLQGPIPSVRADWQWDNPGWVTTDAVMAGAWILPEERRSAILLTNVGDQPVTVKLHIDAAAYGVPGERVRLTRIAPEEQDESDLSAASVSRELTLPARTALAWELTPAGK